MGFMSQHTREREQTSNNEGERGAAVGWEPTIARGDVGMTADIPLSNKRSSRFESGPPPTPQRSE